MVLPNPFLSALLAPLREMGVELADVSFNSNATNLGEIVLSIAIRKWNAAVRIALDSLTFIAANPNWQEVPQLVPLFDRISGQVHDVVQAGPVSQTSTLSFHVTPGTMDFGKTTAELVRRDAFGDCVFYGISLHRSDGVITIDKSLRYEGAAFVRLERRFSGDTGFADIARRLYEDEIASLRYLGIPDVPLV